MLPEQEDTGELAERFRREVQMLASLNHPNIAALHSAFYVNDQLVMAMELVQGEDLRTHSRRARMPMLQLMHFASQTLLALEYAHARGVVHRDIKPANLMVSPEGNLKVLDFGIATAQGATDLTLAGSIIGSPVHMSPEQVRGEKATAQSDIYSLGVTLYELIAGQPPLRGANTYGVMMSHLNDVPVPLAELRPDIALPLSEMIAKALAKDPAARFATAGDFLQAVRELNANDETMTMALDVSKSWQRVSTDALSKTPTTIASIASEQLIRHLAAFIGPIAKVVVKRLAATNVDLDRLYLEASKEIDNEAERRKFLRTRPIA